MIDCSGSDSILVSTNNVLFLKVVPDTSSSLGDSRERAETLEADHREMCRYKTVLDPNFKKVAAEIHAVYTTIATSSQGVGATLDHEGDNQLPTYLGVPRSELSTED